MEMYDALMSYALSAMRNPFLAEEVVQDTFRIVCQNPEKLLESPNPKGWLVTALRYVIRNHRKQQNRMRDFLEEYMKGKVRESRASEDTLDARLLYQNLSGSEEFRLLSEMVFGGLTVAEMADRRGITVNACKKRIQRAKEELQRKMKKDVTL